MNSIEEQILAAQERGEFNNLPGAGRPLRLDDSDHDQYWAYKSLKQAGYKPPVIANRKKLQAEMEAVRLPLLRAARRYTGSPLSTLRWNHAQATFREQAAKLNRRIMTYNLKAPCFHFHLLLLDVEREIAAAVEAAGR